MNAEARAIEGYRRGKISVGKAAELAAISIAEFYKILENEDIPIRIDVEGIKRALESHCKK